MRRRDFVQTAAAGAAALLVGDPSRLVAGTSEPVAVEEPFHGAVLNRRHGQEVEGGLSIHVSGRAPLRDRVTVNGQPAARSGSRFETEVVLRKKATDLVAVADGSAGRREHKVRVVWDRHSRPRYRFAIDDNSFFLRDIAQKQYASLFDCFYLDMLRKLHAKYGARFVLNIYYTTGDDFSLPQFPDRYRGEWKDNADWLRLAFHARADQPDRPYQYAAASQVIADLDLVVEQIRRFAGEATYSPSTVIHWGMVQPEALPALAGRGVRALSGYFQRSATGWDVNYQLDDDRSEYLSRHDALVDFGSGIVFSKIDIVCNTTPLEQVVPTLEAVAKDPNTAEILDFLTHEQYFWPFYRNYLPDHAARIEAAVRFATERGYQPVFLHEGFLGGPDDAGS